MPLQRAVFTFQKNKSTIKDKAPCLRSSHPALYWLPTSKCTPARPMPLPPALTELCGKKCYEHNSTDSPHVLPISSSPKHCWLICSSLHAVALWARASSLASQVRCWTQSDGGSWRAPLSHSDESQLLMEDPCGATPPQSDAQQPAAVSIRPVPLEPAVTDCIYHFIRSTVK